MAGTRDELVHDDFGVDDALVRDIVANELPRVGSDLRALLG